MELRIEVEQNIYWQKFKKMFADYNPIVKFDVNKVPYAMSTLISTGISQQGLEISFIGAMGVEDFDKLLETERDKIWSNLGLKK